MGFADRLIFTTPAGTDPLVVEKNVVAGATCPRFGGGDVKRYPIAYYTGPRIVEKCQSCLATVELRRPEPEDNWPPFQPATRSWEVPPSERASVGDQPGRE
jgi:hypothetical protein